MIGEEAGDPARRQATRRGGRRPGEKAGEPDGPEERRTACPSRDHASVLTSELAAEVR
jgi:hypothetical protein